MSGAALPLLLLAAPARAGSDLRFFADAAPGVAAAVESVLEVVVSYPRKPSRGFRRLPFQPDADVDAAPVVDCDRLEAVPRARPHRKRAALEGHEVCGVRLLRSVPGDADRIELAVTAQKVADGKRWVQVLLDPSINRRGWLQLAPGRSSAPLMRVRRLAEWVSASRRGTVPAHAARMLLLRQAPSDSAEAALRQLPSAGGDVPVDILGVQGDWVRLAARETACDGEGGEDEASCPEGWAEWRSDSGEPLVLP